LTEFVGILQVVQPLWLESWRNIVHSSVPEIALALEATDMQYDLIKMSEMGMISSHSRLCFPIGILNNKSILNFENKTIAGPILDGLNRLTSSVVMNSEP
jgi:hypothetical protein